MTLFLEGPVNSKRGGSIEVIAGSMFSGKTEELIRRLNRARIAKQKVEIFKPAVDTRYDESDVVSHNENSIPSTPVTSSSSIQLLAAGKEVVGIDEAQFFDMELVRVCVALAKSGIRVIAAGLDMDFSGKPFGPVPNLLAVADHITKVHAVCVRCGNPALFSYRLVDREEQVMLGEKDIYQPLCRSCYTHAEMMNNYDSNVDCTEEKSDQGGKND